MSEREESEHTHTHKTHTYTGADRASIGSPKLRQKNRAAACLSALSDLSGLLDLGSRGVFGESRVSLSLTRFSKSNPTN